MKINHSKFENLQEKSSELWKLCTNKSRPSLKPIVFITEFQNLISFFNFKLYYYYYSRLWENKLLNYQVFRVLSNEFQNSLPP